MPAKEMGEKQLFLITAIIAAVVLLGLGVFTFLRYRHLNAVNAEKETYDELIEKHDEVIKDKEDVETEIRNSKDRFNKVKQYLPDAREVATLIYAFGNKCIDSKLEILTLEEPRATTTRRRGTPIQKDIEKIKYDCEFKGTFHALASFISKIENWETFQRFVSITKFSVKAADDGLAFDDDVQKHEISMTLELYKYKEPKPVVVQKPAVARHK